MKYKKTVQRKLTTYISSKTQWKSYRISNRQFKRFQSSQTLLNFTWNPPQFLPIHIYPNVYISAIQPTRRPLLTLSTATFPPVSLIHRKIAAHAAIYFSQWPPAIMTHVKKASSARDFSAPAASAAAAPAPASKAFIICTADATRAEVRVQCNERLSR